MSPETLNDDASLCDHQEAGSPAAAHFRFAQHPSVPTSSDFTQIQTPDTNSVNFSLEFKSLSKEIMNLKLSNQNLVSDNKNFCS